MRPAFWFVFGLVLDVFALNMVIYYADYHALYMLCPCVLACIAMGFHKASAH